MTFPANTFNDTDATDTLTYSATKADDSALPTWLTFTDTTRTFSGTPTTAETVSVKVTASDGSSLGQRRIRHHGERGGSHHNRSPHGLEPQAHRPNRRRPVPTDIPLVHQAQRHSYRHRGLQHLHPDPSPAVGHTDIQSYSTGFRVVGCTSRTSTPETTPPPPTPASDKGVPIYWLNGTKVADQYEDFYDGSWDDEANDKNESGDDGPDTSQSANRPITGCDHDGTESFSGISSRALGTSNVRLGRPNNSSTGNGPISSGTNSGASSTRSMYGLSEVFQVPEDSSPTEVLNTWSLIPAGLTTGDQFRLLFLSSTTRDSSSTNIADFNVFVQDRAAVGHADIQAYSSGFTVVGCTEDDDAQDNTGTTYTSADKGVPIYWLNGAKVADQYEDFYDESWDDEANDKNESGDRRDTTLPRAPPCIPGLDVTTTAPSQLLRVVHLERSARAMYDLGSPNNSSTDQRGPPQQRRQ